MNTEIIPKPKRNTDGLKKGHAAGTKLNRIKLYEQRAAYLKLETWQILENLAADSSMSVAETMREIIESALEKPFLPRVQAHKANLEVIRAGLQVEAQERDESVAVTLGLILIERYGEKL